MTSPTTSPAATGRPRRDAGGGGRSGSRWAVGRMPPRRSRARGGGPGTKGRARRSRWPARDRRLALRHGTIGPDDEGHPGRRVRGGRRQPLRPPPPGTGGPDVSGVLRGWFRDPPTSRPRSHVGAIAAFLRCRRRGRLRPVLRLAPSALRAGDVRLHRPRFRLCLGPRPAVASAAGPGPDGGLAPTSRDRRGLLLRPPASSDCSPSRPCMRGSRPSTPWPSMR